MSTSSFIDTCNTGNTNERSSSSPLWLSARRKLQRFVFHKSTANSDVRSADINLSTGDILPVKKSNSSYSASEGCSAGPSSTDRYTSSPTPQVLPQMTFSQQSQEELPTDNDDNCFIESEDDYSDEQKKAILDFVNNCSQEELCAVPGCSVTKAKLLIEQVPVARWDDLVNELMPIAFTLYHKAGKFGGLAVRTHMAKPYRTAKYTIFLLELILSNPPNLIPTKFSAIW